MSIAAHTPMATRTHRSSVSSHAPIAATMPSVATGLSVLGLLNSPIHEPSSGTRAESTSRASTNDTNVSMCSPMNSDHTCWRNVSP